MKLKYHDYSKEEFITVEQYLYLKTLSFSEPKLSSNLKPNEFSLFGINKRKGWYKKNKKKEIPVSLARQACRSMLTDSKVNKHIKRALLESLFYGEFAPDDIQYLYLMINENWHSKIGISKDPISRMNGLKNSSGYSIPYLYYWAVKDSARRVEKELHSIFSDYQLEGEWFDLDLTPEDIEEHLQCEYRRMF